ncbi:hypothetical protein EYF80_038223 [Liparis tanakae]|uniref:Uncharacterized protein n=1 Tax=Liparis tanakae TaxID=230148 RepID=A0A4Z2GFT4_9TELE|nr:hypothetical protein EYF80_038223 [Liparis tanakae]
MQPAETKLFLVGTSLPGLGFEALLAALAVLARGVVFTLALEVPILQQALGGVEDHNVSAGRPRQRAGPRWADPEVDARK